MITAAEMANPPLRLVLGSVAYDMMGAEIDALKKEYVAIEALARSADFPKGA